jgi:hypothetical protein
VIPEVAPTVSNRDSIRKLSQHDELIIVGLLLQLDDPSLCMSEICQKISMFARLEVSPATICRVIHRNGFTRKKLQQIALQRSVEYRGQFFAEAQFYDIKQFVWVDETGSDDRNRRRKFGYSLRGEPPDCHRLLFRGRRVSAIAAMSTDGVVAYDLVHGNVNGERFIQFLQGKLVPVSQYIWHPRKFGTPIPYILGYYAPP